MASARQIAANRRNARRSTGPKTEAGRRASSINALKHGFRSPVIVLPGENQADFDALLQAFAEEARPASASDLAAVRKLAACEWRLRRLLGIETGMFTCLVEKARAAGLDSVPGIGVVSSALLEGQLNRFATLNRIEASLDRQYRNAWHELDARPVSDAAADAAHSSSGEPITTTSESAPTRAAAAAAETSQSNPIADAIHAGHPEETPQTNPTAVPILAAEPDTAADSDGSDTKAVPDTPAETPQTNPTAESIPPVGPDTTADSDGSPAKAAPDNPEETAQTNPIPATPAKPPAAAKTPQTKPIAPATSRQIARNAPCPCGSKLKYKRCCGPDAPAILHPGANTPRREAA